MLNEKFFLRVLISLVLENFLNNRVSTKVTHLYKSLLSRVGKAQEAKIHKMRNI